VPAKELSPIEIYQLLPATNCKECGETNCMAFAAKLVNREATLTECTPILTQENQETYEKLWTLLKPPIRTVQIGTPENSIKLGGEYVLYRHEFTYFNPTAIAIDVSDEMTDEEFETRINVANEFSYEYIGMTLNLDMIAVRSTSGEPAKFEEAVKRVAELTEKPIILCATDPQVMEQGLAAVGHRHPLIYAATEGNWREMADLALMYDCPITISAPNNLDLLKSLARTLTEYGVQDIVMDPGTMPVEDIRQTIENFTVLRLNAVNEEEEHLGFPLLGVPMVTWADKSQDPIIKEWNESILANALIVRFADALIIHGINGWSLLPLLMLRQNIYTDPRKPVSVESGLNVFGEPDENSPVFLTTNFALTYYTVASDIESAKVDCYLIVVDTEGLSVESAVAGRHLTADVVAETMNEFKVNEKVHHRHLVIPGRAARLSGEIRETTGWNVSVGPMDSSEIARFVEEKWTSNPE
jgi:acetyl-CoA decarbonylase/synthase complex subunit gamma